jgi:hypothetical protein
VRAKRARDLEERSRTNTLLGSWGYEVAATEDDEEQAKKTSEQPQREF